MYMYWNLELEIKNRNLSSAKLREIFELLRSYMSTLHGMVNGAWSHY